MTDHDALLANVIAHPDDDLPRLVLADWYEENGQAERGHVIRCHIEADKNRPATEVTGRTMYATADGVQASDFFRLMAVVTAYTSDPDKNGLGGLLGGMAAVNNVVWHRGFISEISCPLAAWLTHGREIVRRHPVTRVELTDREPAFGNPEVGHRWLRFDGRDSTSAPPEIWDAMPGGEPDRNVKTYPTRDAAVSALSAALILWAKSEPVPRITLHPIAVDLTLS